jgi:hypothetical protein
MKIIMMVLNGIGFLSIKLKVTGGFKETIFGASHEVLFVLK